jgi:hypothetical protein
MSNYTCVRLGAMRAQAHRMAFSSAQLESLDHVARAVVSWAGEGYRDSGELSRLERVG